MVADLNLRKDRRTNDRIGARQTEWKLTCEEHRLIKKLATPKNDGGGFEDMGMTCQSQNPLFEKTIKTTQIQGYSHKLK